jgi:hypothetical protein
MSTGTPDPHGTGSERGTLEGEAMGQPEHRIGSLRRMERLARSLGFGEMDECVLPEGHDGRCSQWTDDAAPVQPEPQPERKGAPYDADFGDGDL